MELVASEATCPGLQKDQADAKDQKEESCRLSAENYRLSTLLKRAENEQQRWQNQESSLTAECEKLRKQNAELQADIDSGKDKYRDLQEREQSATMELVATTTRLQEVQSVNLVLENDKKTPKSGINIPEQEMERLNDNHTAIPPEPANTTASLETAAKQRSASHKENMQLRDELTTATIEIMELRRKIDYISTPVWYISIQWITQKLSGLAHMLKPRKEVPDEGGSGVGPSCLSQGCMTGLSSRKVIVLGAYK